jgi:hypothetical protein
MRSRIRLAYSDFWPNFDRETDFFTKIIRRHYDIEWSDNPDFLIYSVFGFQYLKHKCVRIFYTGENVKPDFRDCDYAFSFEYGGAPQNFRLPYYIRRSCGTNFLAPYPDAERELSSKKRFCTFVYSDPTGRRRNAFMTKLSKYKRVDSGGGYLNNVGGRVADKFGFLREGKFNIAFEHTSRAGYTTEKITDAYMARTAPIYWGNPLISKEFNSRSFVNVHASKHDDDVIDWIIELDQNDDLYLEMLRTAAQPGEDSFVYDEDEVLKQFDRIFSTQIIPVARRRQWLSEWDRHLRPFGRRITTRIVNEYRRGMFPKWQNWE